MKIYHNPRCRKSRETLNIIQNHGLDPEIVLYLETPPSRQEIKDVLKKLGISASELVRKEEKLFKETYRNKEVTEEEWIRILADNPKLIQRPIVIKGSKAIIGRPPERVEVFL
ncbi:MAG: arsenate reductase (glutaredoxin) [Saprospiraceae bacterium]|jgi:arsenate reductase|nr:arsenate reductase (glutaredoxin) [Saprospiraceae bacterium]